MTNVTKMASLLVLGLALMLPAAAQDFGGDWDATPNRVWLGEEYWANPMENWRVQDGRVECLGGNKHNVALLTRELVDVSAPFTMRARVGLLEKNDGGAAGFLFGVQHELEDYRAAALHGQGIAAGIRTDGTVFVGDMEATPEASTLPEEVLLTLEGSPTETGAYEVTLEATRASDGARVGNIKKVFEPEQVRGLVALACNPDTGRASCWYDDWRVEGPAFAAKQERAWGPILWAMHTLSEGVLKMTAQMPPLGPEANRTATLEVQREGDWEKAAEAEIHPDAWTATFRVEGWDGSQETPYRVHYAMASRNGETKDVYYEGTVRQEPKDRPLVIAGFTGNTDYLFPNEHVVRNVGISDPDMLFFSGDQIYESVGGYGIIRKPVDRSILNYLRKWYLLGWSFGDLMRDRVTICLPDDHDVYQGNIWGEGGIDPGSIDNHDAGGYAQPVKMVNVVHRTHTAHHPDLPDPEPIARGITVFHGDMLYGGVSFAIIADRMFKSGPAGKVNTWEGRPDHVKDPSIDIEALDKPGLKLLGDRQLAFLREWVKDWEGAEMKILLSQTIFCNLANYHGDDREYLIADLDSNGWPQSGRNEALRILREGPVFHLAGDQHLPSLVKHGVEEFGDAIWSFCVPSIAAGYPRRWIPDEEGRPVQNRPEPGLPNTGEYLDGLHNKMTVYAIGNPEEVSRPGLVNTGHDKASGYGIVRANKQDQTITVECWRLDVDVANPQPDDQFPGWPRTVSVERGKGKS